MIPTKTLNLDHDWGRDPYTVEISYKTEIFVSRSGREQRRVSRAHPRKTIEMSVAVSKKEMRDLQRKMDTWQSSEVSVPDLSRFVVTSDNHTSANTVFETLDALPDWIYVGANVIVKRQSTEEIHEVNGLLGNLISTVDPSSNDWSIGTKIHPLMVAYIDPAQVANVLTDSTDTADIELEIVPGSEPVLALPAATEFFNGVEIFTQKPNWKTTPKLTFSSELEIVDFDIGVVSRFSPIKYGTRSLQLGYTNANAEKFALVENLFHRMLGQSGEFYMSTWQSDIPVETVNLVGSSQIIVLGNSFAEDYGTSTVFKALTIEFLDGAIQYHKISSIALSGQNSRIVIATSLDREVSPETVSKISWLPLWRFSTDSLTVEWLTDSVSQISISVRTLEDLT